MVANFVFRRRSMTTNSKDWASAGSFLAVIAEKTALLAIIRGKGLALWAFAIKIGFGVLYLRLCRKGSCSQGDGFCGWKRTSWTVCRMITGYRKCPLGIGSFRLHGWKWKEGCGWSVECWSSLDRIPGLGITLYTAGIPTCTGRFQSILEGCSLGLCWTCITGFPNCY